jgi:hypothetical protein
VIYMIEILITIVIMLVIFYIAKLIIGSLGLPANIVQIIYLVMGLIAFLYLLSLLGLFSFATIR